MQRPARGRCSRRSHGTFQAGVSGHAPCCLMAAMRFRLHVLTSVVGLLLALTLGASGTASAASWSPRSAEPPLGAWTHARTAPLRRTHAEITRAEHARRRPTPPSAQADPRHAPRHSLGDARHEQRLQGPLRAHAGRTYLAHLRTIALPDRGADAAALSALAAIFYEAHAPPFIVVSFQL